jgi:hypothetical protein
MALDGFRIELDPLFADQAAAPEDFVSFRLQTHPVAGGDGVPHSKQVPVFPRVLQQVEEPAFPEMERRGVFFKCQHRFGDVFFPL